MATSINGIPVSPTGSYGYSYNPTTGGYAPLPGYNPNYTPPPLPSQSSMNDWMNGTGALGQQHTDLGNLNSLENWSYANTGSYLTPQQYNQYSGQNPNQVAANLGWNTGATTPGPTQGQTNGFLTSFLGNLRSSGMSPSQQSDITQALVLKNPGLALALDDGGPANPNSPGAIAGRAAAARRAGMAGVTQNQLSAARDNPGSVAQNSPLAQYLRTDRNGQQGFDMRAAARDAGHPGGRRGAPTPAPTSAPGAQLPMPSMATGNNSYYNPYLSSQLGQLGQQYGMTLDRYVLPQIGANAITAGGFGGSRQGIAEGLASGDAMRGFANAATNLLGTDYENQQNRNLTNQGQMMDFYTAQRALDMQGAMDGAQLYGAGTSGMWSPLQAANGVFGNYTGFGTNTQSQGGGAMGALGGALGGSVIAKNLGWG